MTVTCNAEVAFGEEVPVFEPDTSLENVDTVFRARVLVDEPYRISGVVTDVNEDDGRVEIDLTLSNTQRETRVFRTATVCLPLA